MLRNASVLQSARRRLLTGSSQVQADPVARNRVLQKNSCIFLLVEEPQRARLDGLAGDGGPARAGPPCLLLTASLRVGDDGEVSTV